MRGRLPVLLTAVLITLTALPSASAVAASSSTITLASGVTLTHSSFTLPAGSQRLPEKVITVSVALGTHTSLVAAMPRNLVGAPRETVLAMARQEHAIAGINGDFFYLADPSAVPRGGITHEGRLLKSALVAQRAALYVTPAGRARIGDPGFTGSVATGDGHKYTIRSANSLENARNGGLTYADRSLLSAALPHCTVARLALSDTAHRLVVRSVTTRVSRYVRAAVGTRALVSCAAATTTWLRAHLVPGHAVTISFGYAVGALQTLLSGGRQLVRAGKAFTDKAGLLGYGNQRKPESFVCVLRDGRQVRFGAVAGDTPGAAGMTYRELGSYLASRHCWSAMTLDGSHSSTLVAKRPEHGLAVENRPTNPNGAQRKVVDGLFVVLR